MGASLLSSLSSFTAPACSARYVGRGRRWRDGVPVDVFMAQHSNAGFTSEKPHTVVVPSLSEGWIVPILCSRRQPQHKTQAIAPSRDDIAAAFNLAQPAGGEIRGLRRKNTYPVTCVCRPPGEQMGSLARVRAVCGASRCVSVLNGRIGIGEGSYCVCCPMVMFV